jgi:Tol biopolymer transport system component
MALIRPKAGGLPDLWVLDVASGQERRLVEDAVGAVWSPAGDALAVNRSPIDLGDTWLVDVDGTGLRRLTAGDDATWSPDGRSLVIVIGAAVPIVALVDVATGRFSQLAEGTSPAWTGEAQPRVAFVEWGTGQVALVDPLTRVVERLTTLEAPAAHLVRVPAPNPPGWALAFVSGGRPWVLDGIDDVARLLSGGAVVDGTLSASPDGTWFAVVGRDGDATDLYVVLADGDGWFRLTDTGDVREAGWRPSQ